MPIQIRLLTLDDQLFLWEMLYQALYVPEGQDPFPSEIVHEPEISRYVQGWGQPHDFGYVAYASDLLIGAAWLRLMQADNRGFGYVDDSTPELSIAVLAAYRGQGIGSQLLTHLLEYAQSHYAGVCLSVSPDNPAMKLYEKLGFEVVGQQNTSLTMVKRWSS